MQCRFHIRFVAFLLFLSLTTSCLANLDLIGQQNTTAVESVQPASSDQSPDNSAPQDKKLTTSEKWKRGASSFVKTTAVGLAFIAGGLAIASVSPLAATVMATASLGYLGYNAVTNIAKRKKQTIEKGIDSNTLALAAGVGDTLGVSGLIEGYNGRELITGNKISDDKAAELLGESAGQLALALGGGAVAARNRILLNPHSTSYVGNAYRFSNKKYAASTWKTGPWNSKANHRYSAPGQEAVYAGTNPSTAAFEVRGTKGMIPCKRFFAKNGLLDLTNPKTVKWLRGSHSEITVDGNYSLTHQYADWAREKGFRGIIAPSAQDPSGKNIILFK